MPGYEARTFSTRVYHGTCQGEERGYSYFFIFCWAPMTFITQPPSRLRLRILSIVLPVIGLAAIYLVSGALRTFWPPIVVDLCIAGATLACVVVFSWSVFRIIDAQDRFVARQYAELEQRYATERRQRAQLEALHAASLSLAAATDPEDILAHLVASARPLVGAGYAASNLIGAEPDQPATTASLLRIPVVHGDTTIGNLYVGEKAGGMDFTHEDAQLLRLLADHAAIVIEHARLADQVRSLAVAAERDRIRMDLHDGVMQSVYGVNLELECAVEDVELAPARAKERIDEAIDRLGMVIKDLRNYVLGLQGENAASPLPEALSTILTQTRAHHLLETELRVEGDDYARLSSEATQELLQIAREAVANIVRHAHAGRVWITLQARNGLLNMTISDNGRGFDLAVAPRTGHHGLYNMQTRARGGGGELTVQSAPGAGTSIDVRMPIRGRGTGGD
jgi:signal transduction histidine kinase